VSPRPRTQGGAHKWAVVAERLRGRRRMTRSH
jgi:hypothetical protein